MAKEILGEKYYDVKEISEMLGVTVRTIQRFAKEGKLKGQKLSRQWYVSETEIKQFLKGE